MSNTYFFAVDPKDEDAIHLYEQSEFHIYHLSTFYDNAIPNLGGDDLLMAIRENHTAPTFVKITAEIVPPRQSRRLKFGRRPTP